MMVRTVVSEPGLLPYAASLGNSPAPFTAGLIVGVKPTPIQPCFFMLHFAITPPEQDPGTGPMSAGKMDVPWMTEHHKQVRRMLPGGVSVIGAFLASGDDIFKSPECGAHMRKLCKNIAKADGCNGQEMVLFHINKRGAILDCKTVDTADGAPATFAQAGLVFEKEPVRWQKLCGMFLLDLPMSFNTKLAGSMLQAKVDKAVAALTKVVDEADFVFAESIVRADNEFLDPAVARQEALKLKGKGKKSKRQQDDSEDEMADEDDEVQLMEHTVQILLKEDFSPVGDSDDVVMTKCASRMKLAGKMHYCAFVHPRASVGEALNALREDLVRSIAGRMQMHCESLVGDEVNGTDATGIPTLHEPPRRILIRLPCSSVSISDYLFPGEGPYDATESVDEVLGFKPDIQFVDDELELIAGPTTDLAEDPSGTPTRKPAQPQEDQPQIAQMGKVQMELPPPRTEGILGMCTPIVGAVSVAVALAAAAASYFLM